MLEYLVIPYFPSDFFFITLYGCEIFHAFAHAASIPDSIKAELLQRIRTFLVQAAV